MMVAWCTMGMVSVGRDDDGGGVWRRGGVGSEGGDVVMMVMVWRWWLVVDASAGDGGGKRREWGRVQMGDPNITMQEYIMLDEEKACRHVIVFNDTLTSESTLLCEPTKSSLKNDEIHFRISFDESNDDDCKVIFDKNPFSYKIISVNDLKTDSKNDNDKVNIPSFPSPDPTVGCFDDLDFFNDLENEFPAIVYNDAQTSKLDDLDYFKYFEKEFPAIVYNDAQTSKLDFLIEPTLIP
ncbi:hypothetical protein Tco_1007999 [Tanacetum coccineum]